MTAIKKTILKKDIANKKIFVTREFAGSRDQVWKYWTDSALLDQWWAPKPWKAITKSQNFKEGGFWLYCMAGPSGEKHWARLDYLKIDSPNSFTAEDSFCDEQGNKSTDIAGSNWKNVFHTIPTGTRVEVEMTFTKVEDLEKIIEMGFEEGFAMAHDNLDALLTK